MKNPKFITLEGIDKTGKTIIWEILKTEYPKFTFIQDPPEFNPWDSIFINGTMYNDIPQISESFILLSARFHNYNEKIKKSLKKNISVISDRYADSWIAYQAVFAKGFFSDYESSYEFFKKIHDNCIKYKILTNPDVTILIIADIEIIKKRIKLSEIKSKYEDPKKLIKVQNNYLRLAEEESNRFRVIKDNNQGLINVYKEIKKILNKEKIF